MSFSSMDTQKDVREHPVPSVGGESDKQIAIIHWVEDCISKKTTSVKAELMRDQERLDDLSKKLSNYKAEMVSLHQKIEGELLALKKSIDQLREIRNLVPAEEREISTPLGVKYNYDYLAIDEHGRGFTGFIEAEDEKDLEIKLNQMGYYLIEAKKVSK